MALVKCDWCGKKFTKTNREIDRKNHNFCCPYHYHEWRRNNPDKINYGNKGRTKMYHKLVELANKRKLIK